MSPLANDLIAPSAMLGATTVPTAGSPFMTPDNVTIDGTPIRVVLLAFAAAAGLTALKVAGFRFNVGVST